MSSEPPPAGSPEAPASASPPKDAGGGGGAASVAPETNTLWVGNLPSQVSEGDVMALFTQHGALDCALARAGSRSYAFVLFRSPAEARAAVEATRGAKVKGAAMLTEFARAARAVSNLWVGGISPSVSKEELEEEFQKFGKIEGVAFSQDQTFAYIDFEKLEDAISANRSLSGKTLGGTELCIDFQRSKGRAEWSEASNLSGRVSGPLGERRDIGPAKIKETPEPRSRSANNSTSRGVRGGADRGGQNSSMHSSSIDHVASRSSVPGRGMPSTNSNQKQTIASSSVNKHMVACGPAVPVQSSSGFQHGWSGTPGQLLMADIVKMGRPQATKHSIRPVVTADTGYAGQYPSLPSTTNQNPKLSASTAWSTEPDHGLPQLPMADIVKMGRPQATKHSSKPVVTADTGYAGQYPSLPSATNQNPKLSASTAWSTELDQDEVEDSNADVSAAANFQSLGLHDDELAAKKFAEDNPAVIIPDHLEVTNTECVSLSFGSFGSGALSGFLPQKATDSNVELPVGVESAPVDQIDARNHQDYYDTGAVNLTANENLEAMMGANIENVDAPSVSQVDVPRQEVLDSSGLQYDLPTVSSHAYSNLNRSQPSTMKDPQGNNQARTLSHLSNLMDGCPPKDLKEQCLSRIDHLFFGGEGLQIQGFKTVTREICKLPSFFSSVLFKKIDVACTGTVSRDAFVEYWINHNKITMDKATHIYEVLKKPDCNYLTQEDFNPVLTEILATRPSFDAWTIYKNFSPLTRSGIDGQLRLWELQRGNLIDDLQQLDEEEDINTMLREHQKVIWDPNATQLFCSCCVDIMESNDMEPGAKLSREQFQIVKEKMLRELGGFFNVEQLRNKWEKLKKIYKIHSEAQRMSRGEAYWKKILQKNRDAELKKIKAGQPLAHEELLERMFGDKIEEIKEVHEIPSCSTCLAEDSVINTLEEIQDEKKQFASLRETLKKVEIDTVDVLKSLRDEIQAKNNAEFLLNETLKEFERVELEVKRLNEEVKRLEELNRWSQECKSSLQSYKSNLQEYVLKNNEAIRMLRKDKNDLQDKMRALESYAKLLEVQLELAKIAEAKALNQNNDLLNERCSLQVALNEEITRIKELTGKSSTKSSPLEETCSHQREMIKLLEVQLAAANEKLKLSEATKVEKLAECEEQQKRIVVMRARLEEAQLQVLSGDKLREELKNTIVELQSNTIGINTPLRRALTPRSYGLGACVPHLQYTAAATSRYRRAPEPLPLIPECGTPRTTRKDVTGKTIGIGTSSRQAPTPWSYGLGACTTRLQSTAAATSRCRHVLEPLPLMLDCGTSRTTVKEVTRSNKRDPTNATRAINS